MKLLIVVDMQRDFIDGSLGSPQARAIVPKVRARVQRAAASGERIIYTLDTHHEDYLQTAEGRKLPVPHCIRNTEGWKIPSELLAGGEYIEKTTFGSLELARKVSRFEHLERIELAGLCTDICVISNALLLKAAVPETEIVVDAELCAGVTRESHENALSAMRCCHIEILNF